MMKEDTGWLWMLCGVHGVESCGASVLGGSVLIGMVVDTTCLLERRVVVLDDRRGVLYLIIYVLWVHKYTHAPVQTSLITFRSVDKSPRTPIVCV